ncbi:MAG: hypothetical protein KDB02_06245 [Acidimicrobiales bacterium]|nr:hypothetical protein [Acidimicrobiales bacterium]
MVHVPRSLHLRALACLVAVGVTFGAAGCGSDSKKADTAAAQTTTTGTAVITTTTTPMPDIKDPKLRAYCTAAREAVAQKKDLKASLDSIASTVPDQLRDAYTQFREALDEPGGSIASAPVAKAIKDIGQFNEDNCGIPFQL